MLIAGRYGPFGDPNYYSSLACRIFTNLQASSGHHHVDFPPTFRWLFKRSLAANTPEHKSSGSLFLTRRDVDQLSYMNLQFCLSNTELHKRKEQLHIRNQKPQQEIMNNPELKKRNQ